jgi:hypothetical protein
MYGLTRGLTTLLGAGVAGLLIWVATQINDSSNGGYWAVYGLIAGAGLVMAFSQIAGGWTKWGWPRLSVNVFLIGFLPVLIAAGWVVIARQPDPNWFRDHITSWSSNIGILGLVRDLAEYVGVLAFGIGLVFGFTFDTTGPAVTGPAGGRTRGRAAPVPAGRTTPPADRPTAREEAARTEGETTSVQGPREPARRE